MVDYLKLIQEAEVVLSKDGATITLIVGEGERQLCCYELPMPPDAERASLVTISRSVLRAVCEEFSQQYNQDANAEPGSVKTGERIVTCDECPLVGIIHGHERIIERLVGSLEKLVPMPGGITIVPKEGG